MIIEPAWIWDKNDITETDPSDMTAHDVALFNRLMSDPIPTQRSAPVLVAYESPTTTIPAIPTEDETPTGTTTTTTTTESNSSPDTTRPVPPPVNDESDAEDEAFLMAGAVPLAGGLAIADGPFPIGDAIALTGLAAVGAYSLFKMGQGIHAIEATPTGTTIPDNSDAYHGRDIDETGKFHGDLLTPEELRALSDRALEDYLDALEASLDARYDASAELGFDEGHSRRMTEERDQIQAIEKILESRPDDSPGGKIDD